MIWYILALAIFILLVLYLINLRHDLESTYLEVVTLQDEVIKHHKMIDSLINGNDLILKYIQEELKK